MSIRRNLALLVLAASGLPAQAPTWKEFSLGPATANRAQWSRFGVRAEGVPLRRLLARAYGLPEHRVLGPGWIDSQRYAIVAQVEDPRDFQPLLQKELADRFQLLAHRETREVPVLVLRSPADGRPSPAASGEGDKQASMRSGGLKMTGTIAEFAANLADSIGRPVIDESALDGTFQISVSWQPGNVASLQAAVKSQLGLELVDDRRAVELLVIDRIEKPQM